MEFWPLIAGLGLFLFGMTQLEWALRELAGDGFRRLLRRHSGTPFKGMLVGAGSTMVLQSSTLVMVLVLAFVGAGVIELRGALGVVYGANLGTTATGWLVATLGFKFDLGQASLGFIGLGGIGTVLLPAGKLREAARVAVGLGLILFGLDLMKDGVDAWASSVDVSPFAGQDRFTLALIGLLLTAVIQSSSGAMMITLSALFGGIIDLPAAAAIAVGSNVGTTVTGLLGSIGGTPDKKRVAAAHVVFNSVTALVALVLLDPLLALVTTVGDPLIALVLFHSLFNMLGIIMFLPASSRFADFLDRRFVVPRRFIGLHIHRVDPAVPEAALAAMEQEVRRAIGLAVRLNRHALRQPAEPGSAWGEREDEAVANARLRLTYLDRYQQLKRLEGEIIEYAIHIQRSGLEPALSQRLGQLLQAVRDAVLSAKAVKDVREDLVTLRHRGDDAAPHPSDTLHTHTAEFYRRVDRLDPGSESSLLVEELSRLGRDLREHHKEVLEALYRNAVETGLDQEELSSLLNLNRALRRSGRALLRALTTFLMPRAQAETLEQSADG
jgi:phosphate:Na+ symporter